jgi:serine/threonine protein phosphatase PrpC
MMPGDVYLLCTDGVVAHAADDEIAMVLAQDASLVGLRDLVLERGGSDNLTMIRVEIHA